MSSGTVDLGPTGSGGGGGGFTNPMTTAGDMIVGGASGTPARLAKGSDGTVLTMVSGAEAWVAPASADPTTTVSFFEDFLLGFYSAGNGQVVGDQTTWDTAQTGSPSVVLNSGSIIPTTAANPGILEFGATVGSVDGAGLTSGQFGVANYPSIIIGGGQITFNALIKIPTISDGTDNLQINVGFRDSPSWIGAASAWNIQYQVETSVNWQLLVIAASTQTTLDSGIAVTTGWHHLKMIVNAAGTSISGFIDGVSMGAAITTNIPLIAIPPMLTIRKTAGTNARYFGIDYLSLSKTLSVAR